MVDIDVTAEGRDTYLVTVESGGTTSTHRVTAEQVEVERLGAGATAEDLIEASFRFLLDREPKEAIMSAFELTVIGDYFPEYDARIAEYL